MGVMEMRFRRMRTAICASCLVALLCVPSASAGQPAEPEPAPQMEPPEQLPLRPESALRLERVFASEVRRNRSVALSHDGRYLAWAASDSTVVDLATGQVVWRWEHSWELQTSIGLVLYPPVARLIQLGVNRLPHDVGWGAHHVFFTPADTMVVASHGSWISDRPGHQWFAVRTDSGRQESLWKLGPYLNLYRAPGFRYAGTVELQPPQPATLPHEYHIGVRGWDVTPSEEYVVTVDDLTTVRLLEAGTGQVVREASLDRRIDVGWFGLLHDSQQVDVTDKYAAVSGRRRELFLLSLEELELLDAYWAGDPLICWLGFSPDGQYLAAAWADGTVRAWDLLAAELLHAWQTPDLNPISYRAPVCAWSADSASILLFTEPQTGLDLLVWKLDVRGESREAAILVDRFPLPPAYTNFAVSGDTRYIAMAHAYPVPTCSEGTVRVYRTPDTWLPADAEPTAG